MRRIDSFGPRARRRLAWVGGGAAAVVVVCVAVYLASAPAGRPSNLLDGQPDEPGEMNLGIPYGTPSKQVLRELGTPTKKVAGCWLYRGRVGKIRGRYSGWHVDAMKFCFSPAGPGEDKTVSRIFSHYVAYTFKDRIVPPHWDVPIVIAGVPQSYRQGGS